MAGMLPSVPSIPGFRYTRDAGDQSFHEVGTRYVNSTTGTPVAAADLAADGAAISLEGLATCFTTPVLAWQHAAAPPWTDVDCLRAAPPLPDGSSDPADLVNRFTAAVEVVVADREAPAVVCWPGAASAALLATAARICRHSGRRLAVLAPDVEDDLGRRLVPTVAGLIEAVAPTAELVRVRLPSAGIETPWTADGPQIRPWATLQAGVELAAVAYGADIVLDARGGAQLLSATPYLTSSAIRCGLSNHLSNYLQDLGHPWIHEGLSVAGRIKRWNKARTYWTLTWSDSTANHAVELLASGCRNTVEYWTNEFTRQTLRHIVLHQATWAQAYLMHRALPVPQLPPSEAISYAAPYLEPAFAAYAYRLPLLARYNPHRRTAYLRRNTLLAGLAPRAQALLATFAPTRYRKASARSARLLHRDPMHSIELGLLRSDWRRHCRDEQALAVVDACEQWLAGAAQRGLL